ncbi:organic hydroperoxide resistance protein [Polyangium sp. y55x31]|uniref:organic hydroperoxide resistance protein n=1 Tax=Polyangium sp. y55x31 TaxID=3042688 RepID=UPI002482C22F|nr:organic hydroperoxide resistance protein [Polyangium sp. y55x31]MDI1484524.1 organic hydroperoxide resistance protein [Polyangium sp. y55x31]
MKVLYTAGATATNGREGRVKTDDGKLDLGLSMPKSVGGPGGEGTNPEQLFAMGYSACFGSALALVARMQKVQTGPVHIEAKVSLGSDDSGGFGLAVELVGHIPNLPREQAEALMHAAHQVCPYSKATRGNIEVKLSVA